MPLNIMDPLEILRREHSLIQKHISELDEMTYSVSVNVRDLSFLFKEVLKFLEQHENKEDLMFEVLSDVGIEIPVDNLKFGRGDLKEKSETVLKVLEKGDDEEIKSVLYGACAELVDRIKAHILAEENVLEKIPWGKLDKKTIEKIELLQIIPSRRLL
jgi:hemerythrin-like domain-containing protein